MGKTKLKINLVFNNEDNIRTDWIQDVIDVLLVEKEEIDKANVTIYWEKKNIYIRKLGGNNTYKILFGSIA